MTNRRLPNKPKVWRAFTENHPLWDEVISMRNLHATWGSIVKYTAEHGYPLTQRQIEFGLQQAGVDYAHHVIPWIEEAAREFIETALPALEYAQATLQQQASIVTEMEQYCEEEYNEYRRLSQPIDGMADEARLTAQTEARENWRKGIAKRYSMMTEYLNNLVLFRRAMTDLLPAEAVREMEAGESKTMQPTAGGILAIKDQDIFWREARKLERTVRRDFEIILAAVRRGENVPELRPLGPSDVDIVDAEAREVREDDSGT